MDVRLAYLKDVLKLDPTGRGRKLNRPGERRTCFAAAGCRVFPTFADHLGPLTMTTLIGASGEEGGTFDLPYAGFTYRVTFQKCQVAGLSAGECPTAVPWRPSGVLL